ncbi:MAG: hypothetical protein HY366_01075 [Candidatus Aenigmarchaeota archaeon]|nr:hypothetical protein [Candidatus Aenigmarchaeota archaeon]
MSSRSEPTYVRKKSGHVVRFSRKKLAGSIKRTLGHVNVEDKHLTDRITRDICAELCRISPVTADADKIRGAVIRILKKNKIPGAAECYDCVFLHIKGLKVKTVIKRSGKREEFEPYKIFKSMRKSFRDAGIEDGKTCERLTKEVVRLIDRKYPGKPVPVEVIKEYTEYVLVKNKMPQVARHYILHRYM